VRFPMTSAQALARVIETLEHEGVASMLVGAVASNLYGIPRATNDAEQLRQEAAG